MRAQYLQDWIADPAAPMSWRLEKDKAGSGALGDIGAHIVDLTQYITGQRLTGVSGMLETFVTERPLAAEAGSLSGTAGEGTGQVTVDDAALFLGRFSGARWRRFEATRFALGRKNAIRIEINGSGGSLAFDFEDMNVLHFFDGDDPAATAGFRRIVVTEPEHPYVGGVVAARPRLGYEHGFTHQVVDLVTAIAKDEDPAPSFADGLQVQRVLDAVERSSADNSAFTDQDRLPPLARSQRGPARAEEQFERKDPVMPRPVTLFTGQWADLPFEEMCRLASGGATTAWRSPAGATTSTSSAPRTTTPTCRSGSRS